MCKSFLNQRHSVDRRLNDKQTFAGDAVCIEYDHFHPRVQGSSAFPSSVCSCKMLGQVDFLSTTGTLFVSWCSLFPLRSSMHGCCRLSATMDHRPTGTLLSTTVALVDGRRVFWQCRIVVRGRAMTGEILTLHSMALASLWRSIWVIDRLWQANA